MKGYKMVREDYTTDEEIKRCVKALVKAIG